MKGTSRAKQEPATQGELDVLAGVIVYIIVAVVTLALVDVALLTLYLTR